MEDIKIKRYFNEAKEDVTEIVIPASFTSFSDKVWTLLKERGIDYNNYDTFKKQKKSSESFQKKTIIRFENLNAHFSRDDFTTLVKKCSGYDIPIYVGSYYIVSPSVVKLTYQQAGDFIDDMSMDKICAEASSFNQLNSKNIEESRNVIVLPQTCVTFNAFQLLPYCPTYLVVPRNFIELEYSYVRYMMCQHTYTEPRFSSFFGCSGVGFSYSRTDLDPFLARSKKWPLTVIQAPLEADRTNSLLSKILEFDYDCAAEYLAAEAIDVSPFSATLEIDLSKFKNLRRVHMGESNTYFVGSDNREFEMIFDKFPSNVLSSGLSNLLIRCGNYVVSYEKYQNSSKKKLKRLCSLSNLFSAEKSDYDEFVKLDRIEMACQEKLEEEKQRQLKKKERLMREQEKQIAHQHLLDQLYQSLNNSNDQLCNVPPDQLLEKVEVEGEPPHFRIKEEMEPFLPIIDLSSIDLAQVDTRGLAFFSNEENAIPKVNSKKK